MEFDVGHARGVLAGQPPRPSRGPRASPGWRESLARRGRGGRINKGMNKQSAEGLLENGFVVIRGAIAPNVLRECIDAIESELRRHDVDPQDPKTWTKAVVRLNCPEGPAFARAGTSPALWEMYDALLGSGRWVPRQGVGGTLPIRFPSTQDPGDAGWHIDGSYEGGPALGQCAQPGARLISIVPFLGC
jgi:hypothetical protein